MLSLSRSTYLGRGEARACASEGVSKEAPARPVDQGLVGYQRARTIGTSALAEEGARREGVARTWSPGHGGLLACSPRLAARARPQPDAPEAATLRIEHALALARVARDGDAHGARVEAVRVEVEERDEERAEVVHGVRVLRLQEARDQQEEAVR